MSGTVRFMLQFASAAPSVEVRSGRTIIHECAFPWILILDRETGEFAYGRSAGVLGDSPEKYAQNVGFTTGTLISSSSFGIPAESRLLRTTGRPAFATLKT